jgi:hypothetical protein
MSRKETNESKHLIYCSRPTTFDDKTTAEILKTSRKNNVKSGVTGALIWRSDLYFQYLEGPIDAVDQTFKKIKLDKRHSEIHIIKDDSTSRRLFFSWAMREDAIKTWMWTRKEVENGLLTKIKPKEAFEAFERLSREIDQFDQQGWS